MNYSGTIETCLKCGRKYLARKRKEFKGKFPTEFYCFECLEEMILEEPCEGEKK